MFEVCTVNFILVSKFTLFLILALAHIRRRAIALKQQRLRMQQQQQEGGVVVEEAELGDPWEESDEVCTYNSKGETNLWIHCSIDNRKRTFLTKTTVTSAMRVRKGRGQC